MTTRKVDKLNTLMVSFQKRPALSIPCSTALPQKYFRPNEISTLKDNALSLSIGFVPATEAEFPLKLFGERLIILRDKGKKIRGD